MTIAAILKHKGHTVITIEPTATVPEVAARLADHRIGAVLVMDRADQLLGIVSERDVMHSLAANGARTLEMSAGQLMTRALHTVTPHTTEVEAMTMMTASRVRHLPVIEHGALIGMISIGDVVKARIMQQDQEVDSLKAYVAGAT
jgi:CBS domain-containing protein